MASIWLYILTVLGLASVYVLFILIKIIRWFIYVLKLRTTISTFAVGPKPHWLFGHLKYVTGPNEAAMMTYQEWTDQADKGAFAFLIGFMAQLCVCHPHSVKQILKTSEPKGFIPATGLGYKLLVPWLGDGLLLSRGDKWFRNRRMLTPAFHYDILKQYISIYNGCVKKLMTTLVKNCENGESVNISPHISICTLNVMRKCAFSSQVDIQQQGLDHSYIKAIFRISKLVMGRVFINPIFWIDRIYAMTSEGKEYFELLELSHKEADKVIQDRKHVLDSIGTETHHGLQEQTNRYVDFLDILLLAKDENGVGLSDQEIRDEVETFMFEGHDTTSSAIQWILYNFARFPEIQSRAQKEIDSAMTKKSEVEWEDLNNIPYTTMCIKESMRIHPPVPVIQRELTKPLQISDQILLPGSIIEINTYQIHHNPRVWGADHKSFNPDRFLPDNAVKLDPYAYVPFSAGPRNCIGQVFAMNEIKTTVIRILHEFDVSVDLTHNVEMLPVLVLRAKDGIKLHFQPRI